jgi:hypothetical protein
MALTCEKAAGVHLEWFESVGELIRAELMSPVHGRI